MLLQQLVGGCKNSISPRTGIWSNRAPAFTDRVRGCSIVWNWTWPLCSRMWQEACKWQIIINSLSTNITLLCNSGSSNMKVDVLICLLWLGMPFPMYKILQFTLSLLKTAFFSICGYSYPDFGSNVNLYLLRWRVSLTWLDVTKAFPHPTSPHPTPGCSERLRMSEPQHKPGSVQHICSAGPVMPLSTCKNPVLASPRMDVCTDGRRDLVNFDGFSHSSEGENARIRTI